MTGFPKHGTSLEDTLGGQIPARHIHQPVLTSLWLPEVIGVAELVNKINGPWFSKFDEDLATAFSIYCGISIAHVSGARDRASAGRSASSLHWLSLLYPDPSVSGLAWESEPGH